MSHVHVGDAIVRKMTRPRIVVYLDSAGFSILEVADMLLIVREADGKILSRYEAWLRNVYQTALDDIRGNGYEYIREEVTLMGNLIIYVKEVAA